MNQPVKPMPSLGSLNRDGSRYWIASCTTVHGKRTEAEKVTSCSARFSVEVLSLKLSIMNSTVKYEVLKISARRVEVAGSLSAA